MKRLYSDMHERLDMKAITCYKIYRGMENNPLEQSLSYLSTSFSNWCDFVLKKMKRCQV